MSPDRELPVPAPDDAVMNIILTRPVHLDQMPVERQIRWRQAEREVDYWSELPTHYSTQACQGCGIEVAIGPDQRRQVRQWQGEDTPYSVLCLICMVELVNDTAREDDVEVSIITLNPHSGA